MNKLTNTALFLLMSVVMFAQRAREGRADGRFPSTEGPEDNAFATPGGNPTPVDQYVYFLIAIAVVMITYVVYRRMQLSKTA